MKAIKNIPIILALLTAVNATAQTSFDAAKLSDEELNGTARYVSMGGAMSALGNDASVISRNPAGIGTYHQGDINLTTSFWGGSTSMNNPGSNNGRTYYGGSKSSDIHMAVDNVSFILSGYEGSSFNTNFGFSYRRTNDVDRTLTYYDNFDDADGYKVTRQYQDAQRNKVNSYDFNFSFNSNDILYMGMTFGLVRTDTWSEGYFYDFYARGDHPLYPDGRDYTAVDKMNNSLGSGWNLGVGIISRPVPALRLGAAFKTPTYFSQDITYVDYLYAKEDEQYGSNPAKFEQTTDFSYTSPWSINLSAGLTVQNTAIGIEYTQYYADRAGLRVGRNRIESQGAIDFANSSDFRVGLEQNIGKVSLRAGFNTTESQFNYLANTNLNDTDFNQKRYDFQTDRPGRRQNLTFGIGYCAAPDQDGGQFYIDGAFVHTTRESVFNPCEYSEDINVKYTDIKNKVLLTVGYSF